MTAILKEFCGLGAEGVGGFECFTYWTRDHDLDHSEPLLAVMISCGYIPGSSRSYTRGYDDILWTDHDLDHPDPILTVMMSCFGTDHDLDHSGPILAVMMSCRRTDRDPDHSDPIRAVMMNSCGTITI